MNHFLDNCPVSSWAVKYEVDLLGSGNGIEDGF